MQGWLCDQADRSLLDLLTWEHGPGGWLKSESVNPQPQGRESDLNGV
jgi:hypothetical protein